MRRSLGTAVFSISRDIAIVRQISDDIIVLYRCTAAESCPIESINCGFAPTTTPGFERDSLTQLHTPVLFIHGGREAVEYENSLGNFALTTVPAAIVEARGAGHAGIFHGVVNGQQTGTLSITEDAVQILTHWQDYSFDGNPVAKRFLTEPSGLAAMPGWSIDHKGL